MKRFSQENGGGNSLPGLEKMGEFLLFYNILTKNRREMDEIIIIITLTF